MSNRKLVIKAALAMFAGLGISTTGWGASPQTPTFNVTSTVVQNCAVATTSNVAFGNYDPISAQTTGNNLYTSGSVVVKCTKGSPSVKIDLGVGSTGLSGTSYRQMTDGTDKLQYQLYKTGDAPNVACTGTESVIWGTAITGGADVEPSASDWTNGTSSNTFNICGVLLGGQNVEAGTYTDTVTATITY